MGMSNFQSLKDSYYLRVGFTHGQTPPADLVLSDISLHLPVLEYYASLCQYVTEFGVREGHSTVALLAGRPRLVISYDIEHSPVVNLLRAMDLPSQWVFVHADTGDRRLVIAETDLLFLDTLHTYEHLKTELTLHGRKAAKYLVFHDTFTCGEYDRSGPNPNARGILPAIHEFLDRYPGQYETSFRTNANNGLWVLKRLS